MKPDARPELLRESRRRRVRGVRLGLVAGRAAPAAVARLCAWLEDAGVVVVASVGDLRDAPAALARERCDGFLVFVDGGPGPCAGATPDVLDGLPLIRFALPAAMEEGNTAGNAADDAGVDPATFDALLASLAQRLRPPPPEHPDGARRDVTPADITRTDGRHPKAT